MRVKCRDGEIMWITDWKCQEARKLFAEKERGIFEQKEKSK